jgi:hypothetical protein
MEMIFISLFSHTCLSQLTFWFLSRDNMVCLLEHGNMLIMWFTYLYCEDDWILRSMSVIMLITHTLNLVDSSILVIFT